MAEYITPTGGSSEFAEQPAFIRGYIEAMFFTNDGDDEDELNGCTVADLSADAWQRIKCDCLQFQNEAQVLLLKAYETNYDEHQAGIDFWFTRNHHGVGYWDRGINEGEDLTKLAHVWGEVWPHVGDDGQIYIS